MNVQDSAACLLEPSSACPPESKLLLFVAGHLAERERHELGRHTDHCSTCRLLLPIVGDALSSELQPLPRLMAGVVLNERYRVARRLGAGGMGVVYEAEDLVLGQRIALKTLRPDLAKNARALDHLKSEVLLARRIGHPHVCRVYDLGSHRNPEGSLHFLSMELLSGPSLRSLLQAGRLPASRVLSLADQLLAALAAAHAAGVLHRDFKPDNVLLRGDAKQGAWHAVVTDFGLARAFAAGERHVTASRLLVGTAPYLAPEQVDEAPLTAATDLYSFGVVLFEMLTGRLPFLASTPLATAVARLTRAAPRPSSLQPELDRCFDDFMSRCLARDPSQRFSTADECRNALQRLANSRRRGHMAARRAFALGRRLTSSVRLRAAAPACLALAVGVGVGSLWTATRVPERLQPAAAGVTAKPLDEPERRSPVPPRAEQSNVAPRADLGSQESAPEPTSDTRRRAPTRSKLRTPAVRVPEPAAASPALHTPALRPDGFIDPFVR